MANGNMGKRTDDKIRERALQLLQKGVGITQVAERLGVSAAWVRKIGKEAKANESIATPK